VSERVRVKEIDKTKLIELIVGEKQLKTPNVFKRIKELSGDNQQKVVISRWLSTEVKIMLLIEPTHGIDVKTKAEIYKILKNISIRGISIMIFSIE